MKNTINIFKYILILLALIAYNNGNAQTTPPNYSSCDIGTYGTFSISAPTEVLTGENIPLNITLSGTIPSSCTKTVTIRTSSNLEFITSSSGSTQFPFTPTLAQDTYTNATTLAADNAQNFVVMFKFPGGITCNGDVGVFAVTVTINCNGNIYTCELDVPVVAKAANYWSIEKKFVGGDLTCGISKWAFKIKHDNPHPPFGAYDLSGNITETTNLPVIGNFNNSLNLNCLYNTTYTRYVTLQNCLPLGSIITNTADYEYILGNGCDTVRGTVTAQSTPLTIPDTSITFRKFRSGVFVNGCKGYFTIEIWNDGNTPWTDLTITDNLNIPGIIVTSFNLYGWTSTPPTSTNGPTTFTRPGFVLNPNSSTYITIYFDIIGNPNDVVTNTAYLSYVGANGNNILGGQSPCPSVVCPTIDTIIHNTIATTSFTISEPKPIPSIVKCNVNNGVTMPHNSVPIMQVGGTITFRIQVGNSGAAPLTTIVKDALDASSQQNLEIDPNSITLMYYPNKYNQCGSLNGLSGVPYNSTNVAGASWSWNQNLQRPEFSINDLPGNCNLGRTNVVVIEFTARILPQLSGTKTNRAKLGVHIAGAKYDITKTSVLHIGKVADAQFVENGDSFNYFLTVTNLGSNPLKDIVVIDDIPSCVQINGNILVKKGTTSITFNRTGNLEIDISPAILNPGEHFEIQIPVVKLSGTICCNHVASVTATMEDGGLLEASTEHEIACVESELCCDIEDLDISLVSDFGSGSNKYLLQVHSGTIPIQEIDVSLIDYHVTYSETECQPLDMGKLGYMFSPNINVGSLVLDNNNSHSLSWQLGSPTVLNNNIKLTISRPSIRNITCCNGNMHFCLKVSIKDVDCNVCEKIVCGSMSLKDPDIPDPWGGGDDIFKPIGKSASLKIRPEMKEQYEKMLREQKQKLEIENIQRQQEIEKVLKTLDPVQREEYLKQLKNGGPVKYSGEYNQNAVEMGGPWNSSRSNRYHY